MSLVSSNPQPAGEVYVHMRDAEVDSAECLHSCVTMFRDGSGGVVGFEILGAVRVEVDGEPVGRCAPTPSAAPAQISEAVFLGVARASGDWENWDGNQIAAAVARARRVLRSEGIEVVS